eukprot:m.48140 g.48140  ORF g.48140 m.48140 type:complete len:130 (+) comp10554_c0_seq5:45-434(+)
MSSSELSDGVSDIPSEYMRPERHPTYDRRREAPHLSDRFYNDGGTTQRGKTMRKRMERLQTQGNSKQGFKGVPPVLIIGVALFLFARVFMGRGRTSTSKYLTKDFQQQYGKNFWRYISNLVSGILSGWG